MGKYDPDKPFKSDGCSWFPDLWFRECCRSHDYAYWAGHDINEADLDFLRCIAGRSSHLGPFSFFFSGIIVTGMAIGRPIRNLWLDNAKMCGKIRGKMREIVQQKGGQVFDGGMVLGGTAYAAFAESLPVIIGALTAVLFIIRIAVAVQEYRINKRSLEKIDNEE